MTTVDLDVVHRRSPENGARLIETKERSGRPKDLAVLPVLRATFGESKRPPRRFDAPAE